MKTLLLQYENNSFISVSHFCCAQCCTFIHSCLCQWHCHFKVLSLSLMMFLLHQYLNFFLEAFIFSLFSFFGSNLFLINQLHLMCILGIIFIVLQLDVLLPVIGLELDVNCCKNLICEQRIWKSCYMVHNVGDVFSCASAPAGSGHPDRHQRREP